MARFFSKGFRRSVVSLLVAFTFLVMAVTGVLLSIFHSFAARDRV